MYEMWRGLSLKVTNPDADERSLVLLAMHIFSLIPNSASCERLFSSFKYIATDRRNLLGLGSLTSLAKLKMYLRYQRMQSGTLKERAKRRFDTLQKTAEVQTTTQAPGNEARQTDEATDTVFPPAASFHSVVEALNDRVDEVDTGLQPTSGIPLSLLFNYRHDYWERVYLGGRTQDEMEIYEFIEESTALQGRDIAVLDEPDALLDDFY